MLESDRMKFLDDVEEIAKICKFKYRREQVRSLVVIQIFEVGQWILFDPIHQGKDIAKMMYAMYNQTHESITELDFRAIILKELILYANTLS